MAENGKIRMPESGNPSLPPPTGSYYLWLSTDGFFKKMDSAGNVSNLSAQSLDDLNDVDLTGLQDGQGIAWNASDQKWEPVTFPEGGSGDVESVNGKTGVVVLDPDDLDDSATDHKFASQTQLDQIATNTTNISTNAGDISSLETDVGNLETQVNTNTGDIATNTGNISTNASNVATNTSNIAANASNIAANASDISDLQDQIDGGVGKTYTGLESIEVNNTDDQISLKLSEDPSGQFDAMSVSGFNTDFDHQFTAVKRDGERINIDLDLQGHNIVLNYDTGVYQLYRSETYADRFIGYCDEIGYWIAVHLASAHTYDLDNQGVATLPLQNWVQLGTACTLLDNGNKVPSSSLLSFSGFSTNDSYLEQSSDGLKAKVAATIADAQAFELADAVDVKQALDGKLNDFTDGISSLQRQYLYSRTPFNNGVNVDQWIRTDTLFKTLIVEEIVLSNTGINLEVNKLYLMTPSSLNAANNTVTLPSAVSGDRIKILDANYLFDVNPVTISGSIDGYTGIEMDVKHSWLELVYSANDNEWKTVDPYAGG